MYFAKINIFNKVINIIVADQDFIDRQPGQWIPTDIDGISPKNYAKIGDVFDVSRMAFITPSPYPSWVLNEQTCHYEPPTSCPGIGYVWDETSKSWIKRN